MTERDWLVIVIAALTSGGFGFVGVRVGLAVMEERVRNLKETLEGCVKRLEQEDGRLWNETRMLSEIQRDLQTEMDKLNFRLPNPLIGGPKT